MLGPGLQGVDLPAHVAEFVAYDGLRDEELVEGDALEGPGNCVVQGEAAAAEGLEGDPEAFVVEV